MVTSHLRSTWGLWPGMIKWITRQIFLGTHHAFNITKLTVRFIYLFIYFLIVWTVLYQSNTQYRLIYLSLWVTVSSAPGDVLSLETISVVAGLVLPSVTVWSWSDKLLRFCPGPEEGDAAASKSSTSADTQKLGLSTINKPTLQVTEELHFNNTYQYLLTKMHFDNIKTNLLSTGCRCS